MLRRRNRPLGQRVGAGVALLRGQSRPELLLVQRRDNGLWDLPGGAVNVGEEVHAAARRELTEETGLHVSSATLLDVFSGPQFQHTYPDGNVVDWVTVLYLAREFSGVPRAADDAAQVAWWPLEALPEQVSPATAAYFRAIRAQAGQDGQEGQGGQEGQEGMAS